MKEHKNACLTATAFLGALTLAAPCVAAAATPVYTVVMDAGSSGTRAFLFEIIPGPYPVITEIASHKAIEGDEGLDDFLNGIGGVGRNLGPADVGKAVIGPLLDAVEPKLKALGVKDGDVVVDLLATAGMRSVLKPIGTHEPSEVDAYYQGIRSFITTKGFKAGEVRTTDGSAEEGLWTWIDLNNRYRDVFRSDKQPVGVVEVGGSSMQVSYPTTAAADPAKNIYPVSINGKTFSVFDRTYIGLGQDDARKSMRLQSPPDDGGARCFPSGLKVEQESGDMIAGKLVTIKSTAAFKADDCIASFGTIIEGRLSALGNPQVETSLSPFYGISAVRFAFEEMNATAQLPNPQTLSEAIKAKCVAEGSVSNFKISKKFGQRGCASASYIYALLYGKTGLFHDKPESFKTTVSEKVSVDGKPAGSISWTTGYLLQKYAK